MKDKFWFLTKDSIKKKVGTKEEFLQKVEECLKENEK